METARSAPSRVPGSERRPVPRRLPVVMAVAAGGGLGAAARHACSLLWPEPAGAFPWATLLVNVVGCALIGVVMVLTVATRAPHHLVRPFVGTGVLGGFTTFSTYVLDIEQLLRAGRAATAMTYLTVTLVAALLAVWAGAAAARSLVRARSSS